jgi:polyisoprenoid-binding protein YceI
MFNYLRSGIEVLLTMTTPHGSEAGAATPAAATALAGPASYQLDPAASTVTFSHKTFWGLATVRGGFSDLSGAAEIQADGSAHGRLEIGSASLNTKNRKRDEHLRSADFFHAAAHPKITVNVTQAATSDGSNVQAGADLTVAGRTRPLTLTARISEATDEAITLTADAQLDRADFGMTWNQLGMLKAPAQVHVVARFVKSAAA